MDELTRRPFEGPIPPAALAGGLLLVGVMLLLGIGDGRQGGKERRAALVGGLLLVAVAGHAALNLFGPGPAEDSAFRLGLTIGVVMNELAAIALLALSYGMGRLLGRITSRH